MTIDPTDEICAALMKPFDPIPTHANELKALIEAPLSQKLPILPHLFNMIRQKVYRLSSYLYHQPIFITKLSHLSASLYRQPYTAFYR